MCYRDMTVIAEFRFSPRTFELGRTLGPWEDGVVELERVVPIGDSVVPYLWVAGEVGPTFENHVQAHDAVDRFERLAVEGGQTLYELEWNAETDEILQAVGETGAQLLRGTGAEDEWIFEVRFPSQAALSDFQDRLMAAELSFEVDGIYTPSGGVGTSRSAITSPQQEALTLAAERGYFEIPRAVTTAELGAELGISNQAVTERMRRGLGTLVEETLRSNRTREYRE